MSVVAYALAVFLKAQKYTLIYYKYSWKCE